MLKSASQKLPLYLILGIYALVFFLTIKFDFFWDTIQLGSQHANFYYKTNFSNLLLPNDIDSGHIPFFGVYLASVWKLFGRSLIVSHLAMLPFVIGIIFQMKALLSIFINKRFIYLSLLLVLLDPTLISQISLISPDVLLVFFLLLALNSIIKNQKLFLSVSIFFLFLTSMRGMMVAFILLLIDLYYNINRKATYKIIFIALVKRSVYYLPALFLFLSFSAYHYYTKGWIGYHEDSPWIECFRTAEFKDLFFNIGILGWRLIDYGKISIWLIFIFLLFKFKKSLFIEKKHKDLLYIFFCFLVILPLNMLWAKNLLAHRYLLPIFLVFAILTASLIFSDLIKSKLRVFLISGWIIALLSGHFWIYPNKVAQGWDATLAYLPYQNLRTQAINYLDDNSINIEEVAAFFPNVHYIDDISLNGDSRRFKKYNKGDKYVLYSNIYNVSDDTYDELNKNYNVVKEFNGFNNVFLIIYKHKDYLN